MDKFFALHTVEDCKTLGLEAWDTEILSAAYSQLNSEMQRVLKGVSHRLRTITWIMKHLRADTPRDAIVFHDMLSQVIYMLLACAEGMGRHWENGSKKRFEAFFGNLPRATQDDLLAKFLVHKHVIPMPLSITNRDSLIAHRQTLKPSDAWSDAAWDELIDCFYAWRNTATHDASHPMKSGTPELMPIYRHFYANPDAYDDQLRSMFIQRNDKEGFVLYIESADPVADIRRAVVQGMGVILKLL